MSLHMYYKDVLRLLRLNHISGQLTGSYAFFQYGNQLHLNLLVPLYLAKLHPMGILSLLINLERFVLQIWGFIAKGINHANLNVELTLIIILDHTLKLWKKIFIAHEQGALMNPNKSGRKFLDDYFED